MPSITPPSLSTGCFSSSTPIALLNRVWVVFLKDKVQCAFNWCMTPGATAEEQWIPAQQWDWWTTGHHKTNKLNDLDPPNSRRRPENIYICCHCGVTLFRIVLLFSVATPGLVNETLLCFQDIFICSSVLFLSVMLMMVLVPIHLGLPLFLLVIYMYLSTSTNTMLLFPYSDKPTRKESFLMLCPSC